MRAWHSRSVRGLLTALVFVVLPACEEDDSGETVLDALIDSDAAVVAAIESDEGTWLTTADNGLDVNGTLDGDGGGSITVTGWRSTTEYLPGQAQYLATAEKLFMDMQAYPAAGLSVTGTVVVTRHSLDYGTDGRIIDASRLTHYVGDITTTGGVEGTFVVDVHANASGDKLWHCGLINELETGSGRCF